jgi:hypothetical protein
MVRRIEDGFGMGKMVVHALGKGETDNFSICSSLQTGFGTLLHSSQ